MEVFWTSPAEHDLDGHCAYYEERDPEYAERLEAAILAAAGTLETLPYLGRLGVRPDTRELVLSKYPYIIVYEILGERVNILRVWHGSQNWQAQDDED